MNSGNKENWLQYFKVREKKLMSRVIFFLPDCVDFSKNPNEEHISRNLVKHVNRDPNFRSLCYLAQEEAIATKVIEDELIELGKIDIKITLDENLDHFIAIEAKKVDMRGNSNIKSYVADGLIRFVTGQYAQDMPIGCMLGYVMGGNVVTMRQRIQDIIVCKGDIARLKRRHKIAQKAKNLSKYLVNGLHSKVFNLDDIGNAKRFETRHKRLRSMGKITVIHSLVPVS